MEKFERRKEERATELTRHGDNERVQGRGMDAYVIRRRHTFVSRDLEQVVLRNRLKQPSQ